MAIIPRWRSYKETFYRESSRECLNWRSYEGGALIKVADSAIFTVVLYIDFRYIAIVSGLEIGAKEEQQFPFQLFVDMVTGQLGDTGQQQGAANIVAVVVAGNSLSKDTQDKDTLNKVDCCLGLL